MVIDMPVSDSMMHQGSCTGSLRLDPPASRMIMSHTSPTVLPGRLRLGPGLAASAAGLQAAGAAAASAAAGPGARSIPTTLCDDVCSATLRQLQPA
jgi:hypothetical protein